MKSTLYVEDVIVPIIAVPKTNETIFRFLGSGFYIGHQGYLLTCKHVIESIGENDTLFAYQLGRTRELELKLITNSKNYDIALCKSELPGIDKPWSFLDESYIAIGDNIEVYGYVYEPLRSNELPFRQRYLKGYITGVSREKDYRHSFELSIPILFGMSGSPLICHLPGEGETERRTFVAGLVYGSRESEVVHHTVVQTEDYNEKISKIVELGLSYVPKAIFSFLEETGIDFDIDVVTERVS